MGDRPENVTGIARDATDPGLVPTGRRAALRLALLAPNSYGLVLALLLISFILAPLGSASDWLWARVVVQGATVLFALHTSRVHGRTFRAAVVIVAVSLVLSLGLILTGGKQHTQGAVEALLALLFLVSIPAMLRRILTERIVGVDIVFGALAVYVMFGMFFSSVYAAIDFLSATPFFTSQQELNSGSFQFFSFVTLTTVGYGNLVPATQLGQSLAVVEALVGQIYLVTLVARLVSAWQPGIGRSAAERLRAEREEKEKVARSDGSPLSASASPTASVTGEPSRDSAPAGSSTSADPADAPTESS